MSRDAFTPDQIRAVRTVDRSLLVSAAAGSGKTSVLAERCAGLICESTDGRPCTAAELLVVTFTEAAASEMRERIGDALRKRADDPHHPNRSHIEEQLALLPAATISTIHSFCRELIRRWFPVAQIDPQANVLDAEEASLLQHEVLEALFEELYGADSKEAQDFRQLVEEDFNGSDAPLVETVLKMHAVSRSQPNPARWLQIASAKFDEREDSALSDFVHKARVQRLTEELRLQSKWLDLSLAGTESADEAGCPPLREMRKLRRAISDWQRDLAAARVPADVDRICEAIRDLALNARGGPRRNGRDLSAITTAYKQARRFLEDRLKDRYAGLTHEDCLKGLRATGPRQRTLAWLVGEFDKRYATAKRQDNVLDFSDLEHLALRVLAEDGDPQRPSDVARRCHERYRHVLVDEFQDVNPVQEAILRLVSRESAEGGRGNLFAVGDVKQCIYAFRLAEPHLFLQRARSLAHGPPGALIHLRENFRSRPGVLDAVNRVFERCMTSEFADIRYDDDAALQAGLKYPPPVGGPALDGLPVELHLLSKKSPTEKAAAFEDDGGDEVSESALDMEQAEREAYLIAKRIRDLMDRKPGCEQRLVYDKKAGAYRPITYRDIVILLRAVRYKAELMVEMLHRMHIPVHADTRGGFFETAELRDMLALLQLLDNAEQDIPLAAVMRSPLATPRPFTAGDLLAIRTHARDLPFHAAAAAYAHDGPDPDLRGRLGEFYARMARFRQWARQRSLADVLWDVYEETGYLAYVGGLPRGRQRRANLIGLHDRARQFGTFRRQGLRRFLRFIDQLQKQEQDLGTPSAASEADDVVRILSVHQSKGLEFPVVFVAGLGTRFNLSDAAGQVVLHRTAGMGMRVVEAEAGVTYPSLAHQIVADEIRRDGLAEELRILYVAMTRAREHLILVGAADKDDLLHDSLSPQGAAGPVDTLTLTTASNAMDWLLAALRRLPAGKVADCGDCFRSPAPGAGAVFAVYRHDADAISRWSMPKTISLARRNALAEIAVLGPLPAGEPPPGEDAEAAKVMERLAYRYEPEPMTTMPSRRTVTELKRQLDPYAEAEERPTVVSALVPMVALPPAPRAPAAEGDAAERGTLTHRFLQCMDLAAATDAAACRTQLAAMVASGLLPREAERLVDADAVAAFLATDLGRRLRNAADRVQREVTFVTRISPTIWDPHVQPYDERDVILVRGMIDALLPTRDGFELIDYKTDAVSPEQVAEQAQRYRTQIEMYVRAVETIWRRPVTARWLVFLSAGQVVAV